MFTLMLMVLSLRPPLPFPVLGPQKVGSYGTHVGRHLYLQTNDRRNIQRLAKICAPSRVSAARWHVPSPGLDASGTGVLDETESHRSGPGVWDWGLGTGSGPCLGSTARGVPGLCDHASWDGRGSKGLWQVELNPCHSHVMANIQLLSHIAPGRAGKDGI